MNAQGEAILALARRRGLLDDAKLASARRLEGDAAKLRKGLERLGLDAGTLADLIRDLAKLTFRCGQCRAEFSFEALGALAALRCGRCSVALSASEARTRSRSKAISKVTTSRTRLAQRTKIGPYELVKLLGKGASGVVHLARKPGLDRDFAVKVLTANTFEDQLALERFQREAQIASRLQHPGVVSVVDVGEADGAHYYVMEFVKGPTLQAFLSDKAPLEPESAALLVAEVARAIAFAHEKGVVHRDLKPANVILDAASGKPRITDFGLARDARDQRVTRTGDIIGTPYYMAPEQFTGDKDVDGRVDVWALGVILFEALTGARPFEAKTSAMLASAVLTAELRSPSELVPAVPRELDAVVRRALSRDREKRYATASELAADLDAFRKGGAVQAAPETRLERTVRRSKRLVTVRQLVAIALVLGALGGAAVPLVVSKLSSGDSKPSSADELDRLLDADASLAKLRLEVEKRAEQLPPRLAERWAERLLRAGCYAEALRYAGPLQKDAACATSASRTVAEAQAKLGQLSLASSALVELAEKDPAAKARRFYFERRYDEAATAALAAISAAKTDAAARRTAAVALLRKPGAPGASVAEAFKFAQEAVDLEPREPDSQVVWAYAARAAGRPLEEVDAALDRAFALTAPEPPDPLASLTRAWVALQRRDPARAKAALDSLQLRAAEDPETLALRFWARFTSDDPDWQEPKRKAGALPAFEATLDELARLVRGAARVPLGADGRDRIERLLEGVATEARPAVRRALVAGFEGAPGSASDDWWKLARALAPTCARTASLHARALVGRDRSERAREAIDAARKLASTLKPERVEDFDAELDLLEADRLWRLGKVGRAAQVWVSLAKQAGWVGDYAKGALRVNRGEGPNELTRFFAAAEERTPDRAELYRLHAYGLLLANPLLSEAVKSPALRAAHTAVELDGALDAENVFLADFGDWSFNVGQRTMAPDDAFLEKTDALIASYATLAPETSRYAYAVYRVAMKWPITSTRALAALDAAAKRDAQPWVLLARAWQPLRDGIGNETRHEPFDENAERCVEALRKVRSVDAEFWLPRDMVARLNAWKKLPPELRNAAIPAP